jgi:hypothetical protein
MHRFLRWAAVLFALIGAAGLVGASPSDQAQRMPVGPPDAGAPALVPVPAAPAPPPAPVAPPVPVLTPQYVAPVAPAIPQPQAQVQAANVNAARPAPVKGAPNSGHRRHLFRRRSADDTQQSARPGLFKRR